MENLEEYMSVSQFAKLRGVTRQAVWVNIKNGKVKASRVGSCWLIHKDQVEGSLVRKWKSRKSE